jgi:EAL domain-containing protein (putative c-di-GMP-specific phosphodiesterase class I)
VQGFLFAEPMTAEDVDQLFRRESEAAQNVA